MNAKSGPPAKTRLNAQMYMPAHRGVMDKLCRTRSRILCLAICPFFNLLVVSHILGGVGGEGRSSFVKAKFQSLRGSSCCWSWGLTSDSAISDPSTGLSLDAAEALLAANFASGRTL